MKPYYEQDGITIYNGDCRDIMKCLAPIQFAFADPPYNVGKEYGGHNDSMNPEEYTSFCKEWFCLLQDIAPCIAITPGMVSVPMWLADIQRTHFLIAWTKQNNCSRNYIGKTSGFQTWEPILVYGKASKCILRDSVDCPISVQVEASGHPCPKPVRLLSWVVESFTAPQDTILDPFLGSGTTLVSAKRAGRKAIGIEINSKYCDMAIARLSQTELFGAQDFKESGATDKQQPQLAMRFEDMQ